MSDPAEENESSPSPALPDDWQVLNRRIIHAAVIWAAAIVLGAVAVMLWRGAPWWALALPLPVFAIVGYEALRWENTSYRITDDQVEIKTGVIELKHQSIPRERLRSVDVSANPINRLLGIATVEFGTGHQVDKSESKGLRLDAIAAPEAEVIRQELVVESSDEETEELATINWAWLRYAPLSIMSVLLGLAVLGGGRQVLSTFGYELETDIVPQLGWVTDIHWALIVLVSLLVMVILGVIATVSLFIENWWNFRLTRDHRGTVHISRGLFVTRSLTIENERLRGIDLSETLLVRMAGGAHTTAIVTGIGGWDAESSYVPTSAVLPPAPKERAQSVAADLLGENRSPTADVNLIPHFRAARRRLLKLSLGGVSLISVTLIGLGLWLTTVLVYIGLAFAVVAYPVVVALAIDAYRNLGHGLVGDYLVTRHGALKRRTIAVLRRGVVGWKLSQWAWHRKTGLSTASVMTAGGRSHYDIKDVELAEGLRFAQECDPLLINQFVEQRQVPSS